MSNTEQNRSENENEICIIAFPGESRETNVESVKLSADIHVEEPLRNETTENNLSFNSQETANNESANTAQKTNGRNLETNSSEIITNIESVSNKSETSVKEIVNATRNETDDLTERQLLAAKRSLKTNLLLIFAFVFVYGIAILLPRREIFCLIVLSVMKGAMPIFTTIANFGTIQSVVLQYRDFFKLKLGQQVSDVN